MAKFNPLRALRRALRGLRTRTDSYVKGFGRATDEVLNEEPIDFSAPSIPYYERLAARFGLARVVLYMVLFVFVVVTVVSNHRLITYENLYYLARDIGASTLTAQSQADHLSYPVSTTTADFVLFRGGLCVAGGEEVTVLSGSGRETLSVNVEYATPCARASDKYLLTFGRGETGFALYNSFVRVYAESTEFPVYDAAVADNGSFAVVTRSRDYTSEVVIYDGDMEKLANYHLGGYVTSVAMSRDGATLGVVSVEAAEGMWETTVTLIRLGNRITHETATVAGETGLACGFADDDRLAVVTDGRLLVFKPDASITGEHLFEESTPAHCAIARGRVAVLTESADHLAGYALTVFDRNGREVYTLSSEDTHAPDLSRGVTSLSFGGNILYIHSETTLLRVSATGNTVTSAEVGRNLLAVLPREGEEPLVCYPAYADRLSGEDFS